MVAFGSSQVRSTPFVFRHFEGMLIATVHGDDFTTAGAKHDLDCFEGGMRKRYYAPHSPASDPDPVAPKKISC